MKRFALEIRAAGEGGLKNCAGCWQNRKQAEAMGRVGTLPCRYNPCHVSEVMLPELGPYLAMFNLLSSEIFKGQALGLLKKAKAHENDFDIFAQLENEQNKWRLEQARSKK